MKKALAVVGILILCVLLAAAASAESTMTLPALLTSVEEFAFEGNTSVTCVVLPDGIRSIGEGAFRGCSSLHTVNIPQNVSYIGPEAFRGCGALTSAEFPEGLASVGCRAFYGCTALDEIVLPDSLTEIGEDAFPAGAKLICNAGSFAEEWCIANGADYELTGTIGITRQPVDVSLPAGEYAVFTVKASGVKCFQWQVLRSDKPWVNTYLTGYDTASLTVQANCNRAVLKWRCEITLNDETKIYTEPVSIHIVEKEIVITDDSSISYDVPLYSQETYNLCWDFSVQMVEDYMMGTVNPKDSQSEKQSRATEECISRAKEYLGSDWNSGFYPTDTFFTMLFADEGEVTLESIYTVLLQYGPGYLTYSQYSDGYLLGHSTVITGVDLSTGLVTSNNPWGVSGTQTLEEMLNVFYAGRYDAGEGWFLEYVDMPDWEFYFGE